MGSAFGGRIADVVSRPLQNLRISRTRPRPRFFCDYDVSITLADMGGLAVAHAEPGVSISVTSYCRPVTCDIVTPHDVDGSDYCPSSYEILETRFRKLN